MRQMYLQAQINLSKPQMQENIKKRLLRDFKKKADVYGRLIPVGYYMKGEALVCMIVSYSLLIFLLIKITINFV